MNVIETARPSLRSFKSFGAFAEARGILSNGTGVNTAPDLVTALVSSGQLAPVCNKIIMPNSDTVVPILGTALAIPVGTAPGAEGTSSDSTAVLRGERMTLKPWYCTLALSRGAHMSLGFTEKFSSLAAEAFAAAIDKGVLVGTGTGSDMLGVFVTDDLGVPSTQDVAAQVSGPPRIADLVGMAASLLNLGANIATACMVLNPAFLKALLMEAPASAAQTELATRGTILGVRVLPVPYAPSSLVVGAPLAVAGDFSRYTLALAGDPRIDEILVSGSDNVVLQAFVYMQGKPSVGSAFLRLKAV